MNCVAWIHSLFRQLSSCLSPTREMYSLLPTKRSKSDYPLRLPLHQSYYFKHAIQFILNRAKLIILICFLALLAHWWLIETHVEIAFYRRAWINQLLPIDPPNLSETCFNPDFLKNPFDPTHNSFPSSSAYNLSLGTLGLQPKVLSLSPGFNLPHHDDCYRFASTIPLKPTKIMMQSPHFNPHRIIYYHLYWRSDLSPISDRQIITLKSLLATQDFLSHPTSNLPISQLILWTNPSTRSLENDPLLAPLLYRYRDRLNLKILDLPALSKNTPLYHHPLLDKIFDKKAWLDGDLVRLLVLWHHGGFWVDMDNLVLRDLRVLGEHEWIVQWDCYDKPYEPLNGHMMHFIKHSPYLCEMMSVISKPPWPRKASTDWGQHLYHRVYRSLISAGVTPFKVLPYCLTDGRSCNLKDRLPDPFLPFDQKQQDQLRGSNLTPLHLDDWDTQIFKKIKSLFSIHLHNQWNKQIPKNGWIYRLFINHWDSILS